MNNPPHLLLHKGFYFSPAAAQNPLSPCCKLSPSLNSHRQRSYKRFPLIHHGEGERGQLFVCDLARAPSLHISHGRAASHRKHRRRSIPSYGKPASFGRKNTKKRTKTHEEAGEVNVAVPAKPSEDCLVRLFEQQPLRLQNNNATFQCNQQELNTFPHKATKPEREKALLDSNGFDGDVKSKADFSIKLLDILVSFKRENQFNDVKSTGVLDSQPVENNLGDDAIQQHPQYNDFISLESHRETTVEFERQSRILDQTSSEGTQDAAPKKDEISSYAMLNSSREDILGSPMVCKGTLHNELALEDPDFSSESSDDDNCNEVDNRQVSDELGNLSLRHVSGHFEGKGRLLLDSSPPVFSSKGWSRVFPRHLSRSTGSRSSPSKSSIPGLHSKYSKPDPKANRQLRVRKKPLQLLPNLEVASEHEEDNEEDGITFFQKAHEQPETELEEDISFDWWDSDEEDNTISTVRMLTGCEVERRPSELTGNFKLETESFQLEKHTSFDWWDSDEGDGTKSSVKLPMGIEVERRPSELMANCKPETESLNLLQLKGEAEDLGSLKSFETLRSENKPDECISFEWSDSEEEDDLNVEDSMFIDLDAESNSRAEEMVRFKWKNDNANDDFGSKNGILSATSQSPSSFKIESQSTCSTDGVATSNFGNSSDQALTCYNVEDHQDPGSNQKLNLDGLHRLPASVKLIEPPSWKSPIFPDFPFEISYSYSEIPKAPILGFRDHFSPFAPKTMERPWTGGAHKKPKSHLQAVEPFDRALERKKAFDLTFNRKCRTSKRVKSREEILGKPLMEDEIISLVQDCHEENRQVNLGRDGLTHNMIHLIHTHWKRRPVCKIKCRGAPTLDMDNVCFHVEDKTGGKIIYRCGGTVYVFRGRNYVYQDRPVVPFMLFRPSSPVYPKLVPEAPAGLTIDEAHQLRILGQKVKPLHKLGKNTVLLNLLGDVRDAFQVDNLVSLDYEGLKPSDYRQIGAKLMELVPCVLLSFRNNRIVLWKGRNSKPRLIQSQETCAAEPSSEATIAEDSFITALESNDKAPGNGFPFSKPDVLSTQSDASRECTQHHHSDAGSMCESNLTDSSDAISEKVLEEHWHTKGDHNSSISVGSGQWTHLDEVHQSSFLPMRVDNLWEAALKFGLAIELKDVDLEADLILHKATVFSEVAPAGPVYTNKLVNRLRLRGVYRRKTPKRFVVPLNAIKRKYRLTKNKVIKRVPKIEMPPRIGLQTDDLVKRLYM